MLLGSLLMPAAELRYEPPTDQSDIWTNSVTTPEGPSQRVRRFPVPVRLQLCNIQGPYPKAGKTLSVQGLKATRTTKEGKHPFKIRQEVT